MVVNGWKSFSLRALYISVLAFCVGYLVTVPWQIHLSKQQFERGACSGIKQFDHLSWNAAILENFKIDGPDTHYPYYGYTLPRGQGLAIIVCVWGPVEKTERVAIITARIRG